MGQMTGKTMWLDTLTAEYEELEARASAPGRASRIRPRPNYDPSKASYLIGNLQLQPMRDGVIRASVAGAMSGKTSLDRLGHALGIYRHEATVLIEWRPRGYSGLSWSAFALFSQRKIEAARIERELRVFHKYDRSAVEQAIHGSVEQMMLSTEGDRILVMVNGERLSPSSWVW